ncbi:mechanosensitive ion channel family protein [Peptoniphilus equinus]|uniref:Mechanosensitive ion channel family protein n=1 Tax=Peptoniphilus equinus TaxID=3016343 RepID=A0ABY7QVW8_9FIRM|nr:mechanosensitive ion channel family protein [Peptoniphilus equinus]WBW50506.1 mechanosensitive ion channel family protein [Peptoniphilus equinus]
MNEIQKIVMAMPFFAVAFKPLSIILVFLAGFLLLKALNKLVINKIRAHGENGVVSPRLYTLITLFNKILRLIVIFICLTIALDILGINTASILATVGIGSLALSFGAQALVKDCINGFFIILENQYSVGDSVVIRDKEGIIEEVSIRTTTLRDFDGSKHIIPNGTIDLVSNKQRGAMRAKIIVPVANTEDPDRVLEILTTGLNDFSYDGLEGQPQVWGVTNNTRDAYEITVVAYARAGLQFDLDYSLRQTIVQLFNRNDIQSPMTKYNEVR